MTSKSPVRSAEDVDETALSYAEVKALCAGNPLIREKMDLDIDVQRLSLLKSSYLSQKYALEDAIVKEYPRKVSALEQSITGYKEDIEQCRRNTSLNETGFCSMILMGNLVEEKKTAGETILELRKMVTDAEPILIGSYRGFAMELSFDRFSREYKLSLKHSLRHTITLGTDAFGNIQRIDNALNHLSENMAKCEERLSVAKGQLENAKIEIQKPFPQEEELQSKSQRLNEVNALLNLDGKEEEQTTERQESSKTVKDGEKKPSLNERIESAKQKQKEQNTPENRGTTPEKEI